MERWTEQARAVENAVHGAATPELVAFGERMNAWFTPPPDALAATSTLGLGVLSSLVPLGRYYSSGRANTPSTMMEYLYGRRDNIGPAAAPELAGMRRAPDVVKLGLCFGACTDAEHEVARLETLVAVEHDTSGLPVDWRVATSSGDRDLDREALSAVESAIEQAPADLFVGQPALRESRWRFRVAAYRYSRGELLTDPGLRPPGKELEDQSGLLGETTMVRQVALVAVLFHPDVRDGGALRQGGERRRGGD